MLVTMQHLQRYNNQMSKLFANSILKILVWLQMLLNLSYWNN